MVFPDISNSGTGKKRLVQILKINPRRGFGSLVLAV